MLISLMKSPLSNKRSLYTPPTSTIQKDVPQINYIARGAIIEGNIQELLNQAVQKQKEETWQKLEMFVEQCMEN